MVAAWWKMKGSSAGWVRRSLILQDITIVRCRKFAMVSGVEVKWSVRPAETVHYYMGVLEAEIVPKV